MSNSYFNKVWRSKRPHLKPKTGSTFMKCEECTLLKDTLYGAPGVRATLDPKTVEGARARHQVHLEIVKQDRQYLADIAEKARRAKAELSPLRSVSIQADAANQTAFALPMCSTLIHGTDK